MRNALIDMRAALEWIGPHLLQVRINQAVQSLQPLLPVDIASG